jgi:hypothetical protein
LNIYFQYLLTVPLLVIFYTPFAEANNEPIVMMMEIDRLQADTLERIKTRGKSDDLFLVGFRSRNRELTLV